MQKLLTLNLLRAMKLALGSLPISTPLAYFCMKQILMIIIGQMKASPKSEILACRNGKMHVARGKSLEEPENYLWINGNNVACFPTEKMTRKTSKRCTQREFIFKVIAFLIGRRSLKMLFRYWDIDVHIKRKKDL